MSRARATALALVNWKGVFYERYQLDRRVTALEGANGAGKTTVMIAAYVVLLPDMSRLRFTNLGETAASGGDRGIWGRLGEPTRPSYAALELDLGDGLRVIAGVLLTRKAEPTLELTPFLISDLTPGVRLHDLLLVVTADEEAVPELAELRTNVAAARAKLEVFASAKDYFAALFELGVGALRLSNDEDRGRLGDMLRTSMTGGISRAVTTELRSFLLREQSGIGDTLGRMRENLNACRRTRLEVGEAQLLEQEISGVYDAGQGMFAAALQATREQAREQREAVERLAEKAQRAGQNLSQAQKAVIELQARELELAERLKAERVALDQVREQRRLCESREALRVIRCEAEQELAVAATQVERARVQQQAAASQREIQKERRAAAHQNHERAARGLADLQAGLDELHRRSSAYRKAQRLSAEVQNLSGESLPAATEVAPQLDRARQRLAELDTERLSCERALALAAQRQQEWQTARSLLVELGRDGDTETLYETTLATVRDLDALELRLSEKSELTAQLAHHRMLAERQRTAQISARACGLSLQRGTALQALEAQLKTADAELEQLEQQRTTLEAERRRVSDARGQLRERITEVQASLGKHRRLLQRVERITSWAGPFAPTREAILRLRDSLSRERQELSAEIEKATSEREQLLQDANHLEQAGGQFSLDLLKLRDELDGELLGNRFEELDLREAGRLEALLGPLAQAIVVDDLAEAVARLRDKPRALGELRLIAVGTDLGLLNHNVSEGARDLCVEEGPALRITRRPEQPSLGRKAREARSRDLRSQAATMAEQLERRQARLRAVVSAQNEIDQLLPDADLLERGDPAEAQVLLQAQEQRCAKDEVALDQTIATLTERANETRAQVARFRGLLSEVFLLDAEDHEAKASELARTLLSIEHASAQLSRAQVPRKALRDLLEALRIAPPASADLARLAGEREALGVQRDRVFRLLEALTQLSAELPALGWEDAERSLSSREQIAPALEQQHQRARAAVEAAEQELLATESVWEQTTAELQRADANRSAIAAHCERLTQELSSLTLPSELSAEHAAARLSELEASFERLAREERELIAQRGAQAERVRQLTQDLAQAEGELGCARELLEPATERWQALRTHAEAAHLLESGESSEHDTARSALELAAEARSRARLLQDRLESSRGGDALAREVAVQTLERDDAFLALWLRVREWLARRVPAQVAQVDDPLLALERLRGHLSVLEQRLGHQEGDLRGASEDVARGIEVQLRRAKAQVRRLNQNLDGVSFGSIAGIRVEMRRAQAMEPVLRALAEGSAQELLFQSNLPTEEALSEILRRYGGGRTGGGRVLDYREYLELIVEVQRKADGSWEPANPTRLSTGEAIGVGAALMMVILAEWERDANLLRARRGPGSLRFLFLDEANRLSQDNLGSLFDLCEALDLQLLIAAPEVARSDGNTTYRLIRKVTEDGREEVIVSGRRALSAEPFAKAQVTAAQVQGTLFDN